jgi:hypothetical protein
VTAVVVAANTTVFAFPEFCVSDFSDMLRSNIEPATRRIALPPPPLRDDGDGEGGGNLPDSSPLRSSVLRSLLLLDRSTVADDSDLSITERSLGRAGPGENMPTSTRLDVMMLTQRDTNEIRSVGFLKKYLDSLLRMKYIQQRLNKRTADQTLALCLNTLAGASKTRREVLARQCNSIPLALEAHDAPLVGALDRN